MADKPVEQYYTIPPKLGKWEGFKIFVWNSETSQFFGRTAGSWAKILLFYVLFYAFLTGFFFAMLAVFYQTLDMKAPKWQQDRSLIGSNPGVGFRPMPPEEHLESTLIWYRGSDEKKNYEYWTDELDKFLEPYRPSIENQPEVKREVCNHSQGADAGKVCDVNLTSFGNCSSAYHYNYDKSAPCIFLKLNKIFNWRPDFYNTSEDLPDKMPSHLKDHIISLSKEKSEEVNTVWVSCEGENPADQENIGPIQYIPKRGFPGFYFPYQNLKGYLSPLVAVWFEAPVTGVLINIECKAWAKNIFHDRTERRGSIHFELMID